MQGALITCRNRGQVPAALLLTLFALVGPSLARAQAPPPRIFFTDLDSGPNSGGETVSGFSGAYVTIYGNFFGSSQGSSTVTWNGLSCLRVVGPTGSYNGSGSPHFWYQEIVVQLGPACTPGTGNFVVTVGGAASNPMPFTVRSTGNIYCVSTGGSDSNPGTFSGGCFLTIKKAFQTMTAGDTMYVEGGVNITSGGSYGIVDWAVSGTSGNPVAMVAYPGASPQPQITASNPNIALRCSAAVTTPGNCTYVTIAGMFLTVQSGSGGVQALYGQYAGDHWRVVGNLMTCPSSDGQTGCAAWNQNSNINFYGNEMTNTGKAGGSSKQYHTVYFSTDVNHVDVGWNSFHNNTTCRDIEIHSSPLNGGGAGDPTGHNQFDLHVHDNVVHDNPCDGIEFATIDPSQGTVEAYNNVVYHVGTGPDPPDGSANYAGIYNANQCENGPGASGNLLLYNNTIYDAGSGGTGSHGLINNYGNGTGACGNPVNINVVLTNNILYALPGEKYLDTNGGSGLAQISGSNTDWFGLGNGPPAGSGTLSNSINSDPKFVANGSDFHLQAGSPAIDAGTATNAATDHDGVTRPQGSAFDLGAYESFSGGSKAQKPAPPPNLKVVVQ